MLLAIIIYFVLAAWVGVGAAVIASLLVSPHDRDDQD